VVGGSLLVAAGSLILNLPNITSIAQIVAGRSRSINVGGAIKKVFE
jgi:hypothetical protein